MGRDFKIGLMSGVVLGFIALIWVATRPSQSPQARLLGPSTATSQEERAPETASSRLQQRPPTTPTETESRADNTLPPGLVAAQPLTAEEFFRPENPPAVRQPDPRPAETPNLPREESQERATIERFHVVQSGETLSGIAQQYYGSASQWRRILEANQDTIKNPDRISPGTRLVIP